MSEAFTKLVELISKKPWIIFVVLTLVFGGGLWIQNEKVNDLSLEVGGLRASQVRMGEIIKDKVRIVELECRISE